MHLKTYRGSDLAKALAKAKAELGADALVLGTAEKTGRLGLPVVEVTVCAARGSERPAQTAPIDDVVRDLSREVRNLRRKLQDRPADAPAVGSAKGATPGPVRSAVAALVASGLSEDLALRFSRMTADRAGQGLNVRALASAVADTMQQLVEFASLPAENRCTFVVGPPGCGKTTTVAKLAARALTSPERVVFFAQADASRVGSFEQADIFSKHIGAWVARIEGPGDLLRVLDDAGNEGAVFVDTPGIGAPDEDRIEKLLELRRCVPDPTVVLLMPSGIHHQEAEGVLERFAPLEPSCVGFSRVDDGTRLGELVTALAPRKIPLAFFTNGDSVPHDLESASPHGLAARLLRAGAGGPISLEIDP